jgi:hypothetical protein
LGNGRIGHKEVDQKVENLSKRELALLYIAQVSLCSSIKEYVS